MKLRHIEFFPIEPDLSSLTRQEQEAVHHCVQAIRVLTPAFYRQVSPRNPLLDSFGPKDVRYTPETRRYLELNGGPWDRFDEDRPLVSDIGPKPKGAGFYPEDLSASEWDGWLKLSPDERERFESPYTIISRKDGQLASTPYSSAFVEELRASANELRLAADLLSAGPLKTFITMRAVSFEDNDYWGSDSAWVDTNGMPFEFTIGPYEVYEDKLFGLKATFEGFLGVLDREATARQATVAAAVPQFDAEMACRFGYKARTSISAPEIVDEIYRGGSAGCGRQFVAFNLPNDRRIHELKGSKKVISRTMMQAKFTKIGRPIAERILYRADIDHYQFDQRLLFVLAHELAHGIGPSAVRAGNRSIPFEAALRDLHSAIEEAKADALGAALLGALAAGGVIDGGKFMSGLVAEVVQYFQDWRSGFTEAHAAASLIEYNWLRSVGGVRYDRGSGLIEVDGERMLNGLRTLSEELVSVEQEGNYDRAAKFVTAWSDVPPEVPDILLRLADVPVEVFPIYRI